MNNKLSDYTLIRVTKNTRKRLCDNGRKSDSYDAIINSALDLLEKQNNGHA